ncbi:MAG: leucine-rich repeat domain-containing protein, partial [Oscillospiraceae bacterium]|nr:leucine-rich repeat domain-containing protein [Oscillospiraceae bacterium]
MIRKQLAFILSSVLGLAACAMPVYADESDLMYENLNYEIAEDGHVIITNCYQNAKNCNVPAEIDGAPVTEIADSAFSECYFLESVTLPESITKIGRQAFSACTALEWIYMPQEAEYLGAGVFDGCTSLKDIIVPSGITELPEAAFYECTSLDTVIIGEGTEIIGSECFYGCTSLTAPIMPESLTTIGDYAFENCSSLLLVRIPENVVNLGKYIFQGCSSLDEISVSDDNEMFCDMDGVLFTKDMTTLVRYPEANLNSEYTVPDGCTSLANGSFVDAVNLKEIDLNQATIYGMDVF